MTMIRFKIVMMGIRMLIMGAMIGGVDGRALEQLGVDIIFMKGDDT